MTCDYDFILESMHIAFMQREALRFEVKSFSNAAESSHHGADDTNTEKGTFEWENSEDNTHEDADDESQDRSSQNETSGSGRGDIRTA